MLSKWCSFINDINKVSMCSFEIICFYRHPLWIIWHLLLKDKLCIGTESRKTVLSTVPHYLNTYACQTLFSSINFGLPYHFQLLGYCIKLDVMRTFTLPYLDQLNLFIDLFIYLPCRHKGVINTRWIMEVTLVKTAIDFVREQKWLAEFKLLQNSFCTWCQNFTRKLRLTVRLT